MTDKNLRNDTSDIIDDDVLDRDQEATLHYRGIRGSRKKEAKGSRGPMPMVGNTGAGGPATGTAPAVAPAAAQSAGNAGLTPTPAPLPTMTEAAAAGSVGVVAAGSEVHFGNEQLAASGIDHSEDPWGAYDNPENIPGLTLDEDDERADGAWTSMAMRGSGTRGGNKGKAGGMGPMMPMGGAGVGAGAGNAAVGSTAAGGGAPGGMMLPGATLGGVGGAQNLVAAQQAVNYQSMSGGASSAVLAGMQSPRATGALFSPPSSGVLAAGGGPQSTDPKAVAETMRDAGIVTSQPHVQGPDGNLYPNPYYNGGGAGRDGLGAPTPHVSGSVGADLNGDGHVTSQEMARWNAAQQKVSDGVSHAGLGLSGSPHSLGANPNTLGTTTSGVSAPTSATSGSGGGVRQGIEELIRDAYREAASAQGGSGGAPASSGVKQQVSDLKSTQYSHMSGTPSQSSGSARDFIRAAEGVGKLSGHATATAKDFSVRSEELRGESKAWDSIAKAQARLRGQFDSLIGDAPTFGVMSGMMQPAYEAMRNASVSSTEHRTGKNQYTSEHMALSADAYDQTEMQNAQISDREIP